MGKSVTLTGSQFSLLNDIHLLETCSKGELADYAKLDRLELGDLRQVSQVKAESQWNKVRYAFRQSWTSSVLEKLQ